jgi:hypothetical protein
MVVIAATAVVALLAQLITLLDETGKLTPNFAGKAAGSFCHPSLPYPKLTILIRYG